MGYPGDFIADNQLTSSYMTLILVPSVADTSDALDVTLPEVLLCKKPLNTLLRLGLDIKAFEPSHPITK